MKNARILLVEDDFSFSLEVEMMLDSLGYQNICKVNSGEAALGKLKEDTPHLIIMDINLNGKLTGIDVAKVIRDKKIPIIFLTSFFDETHFEAAKDLLPEAYLNKPFDELILKRAVELALAKSIAHEKKSEETSLFIRYGGKVVKVEKADVLWIRSEGNYCHLYTAQKRFVKKISLVKLKCRFPAALFLRCHRNILVQIGQVERVDMASNTLSIQGVVLPIGSTYRKNVLKKFTGSEGKKN